jgi:two-component system chemotaxis sensor kinase CheA
MQEKTMSNHDEMKEIVDGFLIEVSEIFEELSNSMVQMEKTPENEELINSVFRGFHTLKGTASFLDFTTIEKVAHKLEDLLNQIRKRERTLSSNDVDIIFEGMDILQDLVEQIKEKGNDQADVKDFLDKITNHLERNPVTKSEKTKTKKKKGRKEKKEKEKKQSVTYQDVQIDTDSVDLLEPFFDDINDAIDRILDLLPKKGEAVDSILGILDTIKNSASFIGFDPISMLTKAIQDRLKTNDDDAFMDLEEYTQILKEIMTDYQEKKKIKSTYQEFIQKISSEEAADQGIKVQDEKVTGNSEVGEEKIVEKEKKTSGKDIFDLEQGKVYEISDDLKDIADAFFSELEEILENLNQDFVELEKTPEDPELINRIFRGVHTIKGTSGFIGFDHMVKLAHVMEDVLNKARNNQVKITSEIMDVLLEGVDGIIELKDKFSNHEPISYDVKTYETKLKAAVENAGQEDKKELQTKKQSAEKQPKKDKDITKNYLGKFAEQTIRVDVHRLDNLMDLVGELVLGRNRLLQILSNLQIQGDYHGELSELAEAANNVDFLTTEIQSAVMKTRMVPIGRIFSKFPRMVRDLARDRGKEIELELSGEETEVDKTVSEEIGDPLVHILRNAVDHGIEPPEEREKAGKSPVGKISLKAYHEGNSIVIECSDDGRGIDVEKIKEKAIEKGIITRSEADKMTRSEAFDLIFKPGFSTASKVTNISGRGVGMDVVKTHVTKLNGIISIDSEVGKGTTFRLQLPLTLAIIQGLVIRVQDEVYIIPLSSVLETYRIHKNEMFTVKGHYVIRLRNEVLPIIQLEEIFDIPKVSTDWENRYVVVVGLANMRAGIVVDELIGQKEIVIKSLGSYLGIIKGIGGASILGDGRVRLIVDIGELLTLAKEVRRQRDVRHEKTD